MFHPIINTTADFIKQFQHIFVFDMNFFYFLFWSFTTISNLVDLLKAYAFIRIIKSQRPKIKIKVKNKSKK